jgi:hypothetical protein
MKNYSLLNVLLLISLLFGCQNIEPNFETNKICNEKVDLKSSATSYTVNITGPNQILLKGDNITITGTIKDNNGKRYANKTIGVEDGLKLFCTTTNTDKNGNISYKTKVVNDGVAIVKFLIDDKEYSFLFQAAYKKSNGKYYTNSFNYTSLKFKNTSGKDLKIKTNVDNGSQYTQKLKKNSTQTIISGKQGTKTKRVTGFFGVTYIIGAIAGGDISLTIDTNGIAQISVSAGVALLRGQFYTTSQSDVGLCWAPGGDLGASPIAVSAEGTLCVGSDGLNIGGSLGASNFVGGININIASW